MYSWGSCLNGELGLGGLEDPYLPAPRQLKQCPTKVCSVAVGGRHTLVLTEEGALYSCGSNEFGQLGREGSQTKLEQITSLSEYTLRGIAAGANHSLAVDEWGSLFTWGSDEYGQLGHNQGAQSLRVPRLVKSLGTIKVTLVSAGMYHSLALTAGGQLFTWGSNSKGQLGAGKTVNMNFVPTLVDSLAGVPLAGAVCGGNHSIVVTVSGAVFSFGSNNHGQLGLGDEEDRYLPTQIRTLRYQNIAHGGVAAGSEHSVALTTEGGVFTWGSSRCGQLGHGLNNTENVPRKILELMGTEVTQIAAGDRHTLAFVPKSNRLHAFGVAGSGQLGQGAENIQNANIPQVVREIDEKISLISAGGNSSWLSVGTKEFSQLSRSPAVRLITKTLLNKIENADSEMLDHDLMEDLELVFPSLSCINGSFLLPDHYGCRGSNSGVDLSAWAEAVNIIKNCPNSTVSSIVQAGLLSVIQQLKTSPPDVETLRFYLILPMFFEIMDLSSADDLHFPFAESMLSLQGNAIKVVEKWIVKSPGDWFLNLIETYKQASVPYLKKLNETEQGEHIRSLSVALIFLTFLSRVNTEASSPLSYEAFYIIDLHKYCDLRISYFNWKIARMNGQDVTKEFFICNFPFIFDPVAKEIILRADQYFSQRAAQQTAFQNMMFQMLTSGQAILNQFLDISVTRDNIVQDTVTQLEIVAMTDQSKFKMPLRVEFRGEEAEDAGGVTKEFFLLLIKEILNPDYGMFTEYDEANTIWFNPNSFESAEYFVMIGIVCGLAIYNFTIINLPFPLALYKKIQGEQTEDITDLAELSPTMAKSLQDLLNYTEDDVEDVFCLHFSITESFFGEVVSKPLKPGGEDISVTNENKDEYVKLYVDYILNKSCKAQFEAFKLGFLKVVNKQVLQLFQSKELMSLVIGNENYNWKMLEETCEYKEGYSKDHQTVRFFWEAFSELSEEEKRKFLLFLTGSDRIPARGMESVKITIQRTGDTNFLPVAHTCFNILDLPEYSTKEKLKYKLVQAIQQTKGFGIV